MNEFYKKLIQKTEVQREKDPKLRKRESELLEVKDERTIPKLRVTQPKPRRRRKRGYRP